MATLSREALLTRMFSDAKHYPYGFSRSGDFSINESKALAQYGCLIAALVDGHLAPSCDEDHAFLQAAFAERPPQNNAERAWLKYQQRINRPKMASIYGNRKAELGEDDESVSSSDTQDIQLDVEE